VEINSVQWVMVYNNALELPSLPRHPAGSGMGRSPRRYAKKEAMKKLLSIIGGVFIVSAI